MKNFDLIIIGGGAGAFAAAIKANELGAKTLMINKGLPLGGTCVNVGCVPSKVLLWAGEILHQSKYHQIPGLDIEIKNFDFTKVVQNEINLVKKMRNEKYTKVLSNLEHVTFIHGRARFVSSNTIIVNNKKYSAKKFIVATGSTAKIPKIKGINKVGFITHIEALKLKKQPKELVVIGAGPVGLEFAQMYSRFGTKVTILHSGTTILSRAETQLTNRLHEIFEKEGIVIKTNTKVISTEKIGDKKIVNFSINNQTEKVCADEILLAAGKTANTFELGLDKVEIELTEKKAIKVTPSLQTSQPHIFAVGDVTNAPLRLETTAGQEGSIACENALKETNQFINYNLVPWTIFTDPQLSSVGVTEDEQTKQLGVCACRSISFEYVPKAIMINRTEGIIKMAIHPESRKIMGVHILAPNAGDLIAEAMILIKNKNTIDDVIKTLPVFPTLSEAIKLVALSFTKDIKKLSCCV